MSSEEKPPGEPGDDPTPPAPEAVTPASPPEAPPEEDDFASMLDASLAAVSFQVGQTVEGEIVALDATGAFVDIGGKGEATIDLEELQDEDGQIEVRTGDRLKAVVVAVEGGLKLSRKLARGAAAREQLQAAFQSGLAVEGRVEAVNKGGFQVRVAGQRAFCPASQMDTVRGTDPADHVGKTHSFRILELKDGGKDLVISRRVLLEEEARRQAADVMRTVVPGAVLRGQVVSVQDYGAFIDIGAGIQGLLHVSEMGWTRVSRPAEIVQVGQEITVHILKVDAETRKISLSLKQLQKDPWAKVGATYSIGQITSGRVTRMAEFGAFVELEPGIEALAHVSTFPPGKAGWQSVVQVGATGRYRIESIDLERRRIGVALQDAVRDEEAAGTDGTTRDEPAAGSPTGQGLGSLADQLRDAMKRGRGGD